VIVLATLFAATATAAAQPQDPWKDPSPPGFIGAELTLHVPIMDSTNERTYGHLDGYGYDAAPVTGAVAIYGGYAVLPMVELGAACEYWSSSSGMAPGSADEMLTVARELGLFVRGKIRHPRRTMEMAARFEAGVLDSRTELRRESLHHRAGYLRSRIEYVLGPEWLRGSVQFSYTAVFGAAADAGYLVPALGGVSLGLGMVHRF
jgi:hypothetical protein